MDKFFPTVEMLSATGAEQKRWHGQAEETARSSFGREVFIRGVVEVSNFCRENCAYCGMRRDNRGLQRYRARLDELTELLLHHRPECITDINFQAGEDPVVVREVVIPLIETLREQTNLGFSVCLGTLNEKLYSELRDAGAGMYIIKFETGDLDLYREMQSPGTLPERLRHIRLLASEGWFVSSGFIAGLPGQSLESLLLNFQVASELPLNGCSVSPFIPGEATLFSDSPAANLDLTVNCMAALRLMNPDWVIPAVSALNLTDAVDGYRRGLMAGANLCTINLTPSGLRDDYLLYKRKRYIMNEERILRAIAEAGLKPSRESLAARYWREPAGQPT